MTVSNKAIAANSKNHRKMGEYTHKNGVVRETFLVMGMITSVNTIVRTSGVKVYEATISMPNGKEFVANTVNLSALNSYPQESDIAGLIVVQKDPKYGNLLCEPFTAISEQLD